MGRKQTPQALKKLRGNPGKRPLNDHEPALKTGKPHAPKELAGLAKREWDRVAKMLHDVGLLTTVDRAALASYCIAWQRLVEAEEDLTENGLVISVATEHGVKRIKNPAWSIQKEAMGEIRAWASEFGMTPSSRGKIQIPGAEDPESEADPYDEWRKKGEQFKTKKATKEA